MFCMDEYSLELFRSLSFIIFSPKAPALLYYSHIPATLVAFLLSLFIVFKNREALEAKILVAISLIYSTWAVMNLFIWTQIDARVIMYLWSFWFSIFALIFVLSFYFLYVFIKKRDVGFFVKLLFIALLLPIIIPAFTSFNLAFFDVGGCNAAENPLMLGYSYLLTTVIFLWMVIFSFNEYYKTAIENKKRVALASLGVLLFLISFSVATYVPSVLGIFESKVDTFAAEMYGFFGMTIFMGFLSYLIVRYKAFNIKVLAAQALVLTLVALIASEFFFVENYTNIILVGITLVLIVVFGFLLVRSIKREVSLREQLQSANEGQANLLHIINHQIKGYLTKARLVFDDLLNDQNHNLSGSAKPMIQQGFDSVTEGVRFVQDFLNASNIERGTFTYNMVLVDFKKLVVEVTDKQRDVAKEKGLALGLKVESGDYNMTGDITQLEQAVRNLIDNSVKYTPQGSINVQLTSNDKTALLTVQDTGVGISDDLKPRLFTKGGRGKDSQKINVNSTGFGLAFVKGVVEAHKGRVWAESAGPGKGSTFYMELPFA
ncbi:MAG: hypothetical protein EXS69_01130 [Candidatus Zambryskibacteria bacterium]|nr:hypothetical protein [Candidatus Zambryskibacteria bacterium]